MTAPPPGRCPFKYPPNHPLAGQAPTVVPPKNFLSGAKPPPKARGTSQPPPQARGDSQSQPQARGDAQSSSSTWAPPRGPLTFEPPDTRTASLSSDPINLCLDWHKVLDIAWDRTAQKWDPAFLSVLKHIADHHKPVRLLCLSFVGKENAEWVKQEITDALHSENRIGSILASGSLIDPYGVFTVGIVHSRVGPTGKASVLHWRKIHVFIDDNPTILRECKKTGCKCIQVVRPHGRRQLLDALQEVIDYLDSRFRDTLPVARQLSLSEYLEER